MTQSCFDLYRSESGFQQVSEPSAHQPNTCSVASIQTSNCSECTREGWSTWERKDSSRSSPRASWLRTGRKTKWRCTCVSARPSCGVGPMPAQGLCEPEPWKMGDTSCPLTPQKACFTSEFLPYQLHQRNVHGKVRRGQGRYCMCTFI